MVVVALAGNPNVGKSTIFNALTGLHQHTGNWPGKTVAFSRGHYHYNHKTYLLVDTPGVYSMDSNSAEEKTAGDFFRGDHFDVVVAAADASCLERNLILALQIMELGKPMILCVNLVDEAERKGYEIRWDVLAQLLGIPIVPACARSGEGLEQLRREIEKAAHQEGVPDQEGVPHPDPAGTAALIKRAEQIAAQTVRLRKPRPNEFSRGIDRVLTSKVYGLPIMFLFLAVIFWLTISGSNIPTRLLAGMFQRLEGLLVSVFAQTASGVLADIRDALIYGTFRTVGWVISVMLPPMAIFFPLFTFLEDLGLLPRIAFNLDYFFKNAHTCGKQALTMCMGFGCNAAGVTGCRIIDSPRERLIAILTNNFVPCNGRYPCLITLSALFLGGGAAWPGGMKSALWVALLVLLGVFLTLFLSWALSKTLLRGDSAPFILELPPYRRPQAGKMIIHSLLHRTLFVLGRAAAAAAPAGLLIWLAANAQIHSRSFLSVCSDWLQPAAHWMGMDGSILLAFILGIPANEIVLPLIAMEYSSGGVLAELGSGESFLILLKAHGWTWLTALNVMLFSLMHFPCATTLWTIRKETGSWKWTGAAFVIPTLTGALFCAAVTLAARMLGLSGQ
ncbi:MAG: ferrous iron transporter B [Peptococcaceae bacterium]|jgi:ferrous iron transport protein B|nr:ferrous iron transporter B [Peptococcaceae bacterium]